MTAPERTFRVKNPEHSPPGGWHWKDTGTGKLVTADTLDHTVERATDYLLKSGGDTGDVEGQVHECTAKFLVSRGRGDLVEIIGEVKRTAMQYLGGMTAIALGWWRESPIYSLIEGENEREGVHVDQAEADRRANICCGPKGGEPCEGNVIPSGKGWIQAWTDGEMLKSVDGKETARHKELGVCHLCSCELRAAVWWSPKIIKASMRVANYEKNLPGHCWKLDKENPKTNTEK